MNFTMTMQELQKCIFLNINNKHKVNNIKIYFMTNEKLILKIQIKAIDQKYLKQPIQKYNSTNNIKYKNETLNNGCKCKQR